MALIIKWSKEAKNTYEGVLIYLKTNWSDKEIEKFINKTNSILTIISHQPYILKRLIIKKLEKLLSASKTHCIILFMNQKFICSHFGIIGWILKKINIDIWLSY